MKAVLQRVTRAKVTVNDKPVGQIGQGLVVLLGVAKEDGALQADQMAKKLLHLRIFADQAGKMNQSLLDTGKELLLISQFTLFADCSHGRRPSFFDAAASEQAKQLYLHTGKRLEQHGVHVSYGQFGANMQLELINDGPVTITLNTHDWPISSKGAKL